MKRLLPALALVTLILSSCTVTETMNINNDSSINSKSEIKTEDFFVEVLEDFGEFMPEKGESIMDSAMTGFSDRIASTTNIDESTLLITGHNEYVLDFSTDDILSLIGELGGENQSLFKLESNSVSFYVDIENFEELTRIVPFLSDPNFEVYGPLYNQGTSEEDYLDMIYYLLGEEGPDAIKNGSVKITIYTPGEISDIEGADKIDSHTAEYSFPIIDFLLLNEPLSFSISWK